MRVFIQVYIQLLAKFQKFASYNNKNKSKFITVVSANNFRIKDPHSLELNPLDFYLWGHLKTLVYSGRIKK